MTAEQNEETKGPLDEAFSVWWGHAKVEQRQKTSREEGTRAGEDDPPLSPNPDER
jgi:hypothetical protein